MDKQGIYKMIDSLCESVYKMDIEYRKNNFSLINKKKPDLVLICSYKIYCEIRGNMSNKIYYYKDIPYYNIPILIIIGFHIPVILRNDLPDETVFQLMYREDYERLEKEEIYKKLMSLWED